MVRTLRTATSTCGLRPLLSRFNRHLPPIPVGSCPAIHQNLELCAPVRHFLPTRRIRPRAATIRPLRGFCRGNLRPCLWGHHLGCRHSIIKWLRPVVDLCSSRPHQKCERRHAENHHDDDDNPFAHLRSSSKNQLTPLASRERGLLSLPPAPKKPTVPPEGLRDCKGERHAYISSIFQRYPTDFASLPDLQTGNEADICHPNLRWRDLWI